MERKKPLRILFVIKSLVTAGGGAEKVLSQLTSALASRRYEIIVATFDSTGTTDFYPFDARVKRLRLGIGYPGTRTGLFELVRKTRALRSLLQDLKPDVAIGFMHSAFVPLATGAFQLGVPVVASEHIAYEHYDRRPLEKLLVFVAAQLCTAMTIPLERVRLGFPASIRRRMSSIPNPVVMGGERRRARKKRRRILFVANFRAQKDHQTLVKAFAELAPHYRDWEMRFVGSGELEEQVRQQVLASGLRSRVTFAGPTNDVAAEYASADLVAVPSSYESFGLATAEALASGIPVVGFADSPGTNQLIGDGVNGILVSGDDRSSVLADGLARLMRDEDLRRRLGASGPASVAQYSMDAITEKWEELIARAASHRRRIEAVG